MPVEMSTTWKAGGGVASKSDSRRGGGVCARAAHNQGVEGEIHLPSGRAWRASLALAGAKLLVYRRLRSARSNGAISRARRAHQGKLNFIKNWGRESCAGGTRR